MKWENIKRKFSSVTPPATLWNVAGLSDWCFYDRPRSTAVTGQPPQSENVQADISVINHSELENRGLKSEQQIKITNWYIPDPECKYVCLLHTMHSLKQFICYIP